MKNEKVDDVRSADEGKLTAGVWESTGDRVIADSGEVYKLESVDGEKQGLMAESLLLAKKR